MAIEERRQKVMPVVSKKQARFMFAKHPEIMKKKDWKLKKGGYKKLPESAKKKKARKLKAWANRKK